MQRSLALMCWCASATWSGGCVPVVFSTVVRNGTSEAVQVRSTQTDHSVEIEAGRAKEIQHSEGNLIVTTWDGRVFQFSDIIPDRTGITYVKRDPALLAAISGRSVGKLNLLLNQNMRMYALIRGKKTVDEKVPQPVDYPKIGQQVRKAN